MIQIDTHRPLSRHAVSVRHVLALIQDLEQVVNLSITTCLCYVVVTAVSQMDNISTRKVGRRLLLVVLVVCLRHDKNNNDNYLISCIYI